MTLQLPDILLFGIPLAASAITLTGLHYFPWHKGTAKLNTMEAYMVGTAVVVGYPVLAMLAAISLETSHGELFWMALLIINTLVCGATVCACYEYDKQKPITLEEVFHANGTNSRTHK